MQKGKTTIILHRVPFCWARCHSNPAIWHLFELQSWYRIWTTACLPTSSLSGMQCHWEAVLGKVSKLTFCAWIAHNPFLANVAGSRLASVRNNLSAGKHLLIMIRPWRPLLLEKQKCHLVAPPLERETDRAIWSMASSLKWREDNELHTEHMWLIPAYDNGFF